MGENGSGKTTFLDAIAIALGAILTHLPEVSGITFSSSGDILQHSGRESPCAWIKVECSNGGPTWHRLKRSDKSQQTTREVERLTGEGVLQKQPMRALHQYLEEKIFKPWKEEQTFELPVVAYYGVSRALLDVPIGPRGFPKEYSRFQALADSLNAVSRFRNAFIWFYNKENEELRLQQEKQNFGARLPELEAVRQAIQSLLPNTRNPHIVIRPLRFLIEYNGQEFGIDQLSDGYKTMLGLAMDLSIRMAIANPDLSNPLATGSIVLIDEVDLHLHPRWQQRVISDLLRTFPKTQFILTSHSPILVESVNNLLKRHAVDNLLTKSPPEASDGEMANIANLYPLAPKDTQVYHISKDGEERLLDQEEGLTGNTLIEQFNTTSDIFDRMRDLEYDLQPEEEAAP